MPLDFVWQNINDGMKECNVMLKLRKKSEKSQNCHNLKDLSI